MNKEFSYFSEMKNWLEDCIFEEEEFPIIFSFTFVECHRTLRFEKKFPELFEIQALPNLLSKFNVKELMNIGLNIETNAILCSACGNILSAARLLDLKCDYCNPVDGICPKCEMGVIIDNDCSVCHGNDNMVLIGDDIYGYQ